MSDIRPPLKTHPPMLSQVDKVESLYLHFPFCETKCHYCDFYSLAARRVSSQERDRYHRDLRLEAQMLSSTLAPSLSTLFMGGGTPSMTSPQEMEQALEPLHLDQRLNSENYEWTMEANPSSLDLAKLRDYRNLGVNRISLGVQSLQDHHLKSLGRAHDRSMAFRALNAIFESGFDNVSADLICGVPQQTIKELEQSIDELLSFPLTHLSIYLLTLPSQHFMFSSLPHEETQLEHLLFIDKKLSAFGFEHYEISNFCRPNKRAQHNLRYWQGQTWLGLGPSAHSFVTDQQQRAWRWKNVSSLKKYHLALADNRLPIESCETLDEKQKILEKWMLTLRLSDGFPRKWLEKDSQRKKAEQLMQQDLLVEHPEKANYLRLSPRGLALSDQVILELSPS